MIVSAPTDCNNTKKGSKQSKSKTVCVKWPFGIYSPIKLSSNRKKMQSCPTCIMKHFKAYLNFIFIRLPIVFYIFSCLQKNFFAFDFVLTDILRQILRTLEKFRQNANGMWKEDSRKFLRKRKLTTHKKKVVDDVEKFCRIITACI